MPTASDLCSMYDKGELIKEFIDRTIITIEISAKHGEKYENVDIPMGLTRVDVELPLKKAFPDCKVKWKWFIQSYRIQWA